jgi:hypothetical protein
MSTQSLNELKKPFSDLAINPLDTKFQRNFVTWLNGNTTSERYKQQDVPSKLKFFNNVKKNLQTIINNIGNRGVGAGTRATDRSKELYRAGLQSLVNLVSRQERPLISLPAAVPAPPTKDMYSSVDTDARLGEIQKRLLQFQENQRNHEEFIQMASEAKALIVELKHIQKTLPAPERTTLFTISVLLKALDAWHRYFITVERNTTPEVVAPMIEAPPEGGSRNLGRYEESVAAALNPITGRRVDLSLEERVALLHDFSGRGTKKEPGERYFEGGKRKTRKRRRRRKRKTKKHRKKKRTRRRKPKKKHRRTRKK